jgi:DNA repair exonuclease SbcCD nuclease subunit
MIIDIDDLKVKFLGDTHLGRKFRHHVPLHRIGHREAMVWDQFVRELSPEGAKVHVHLGDLFDAPVVDLGTILETAMAYRDAASKYKDCRFYVLRGNHDASRDLEATSAFEVFSRLVENHVTCVTGWEGIGHLLMCGWDPVKSAEEIIAGVPQGTALVAAGHWDVDARSAPFNMIPTASLAKIGITSAYTGHVHLPDSFARDDVQVEVVGSMQPFSFAEDATGDWYVTTDLETLANELELHGSDFARDKCIRVYLKPGEVFDLDIDCLQLKVERAAEETDLADIDVSLGDFSLQKIFEESMAGKSIPAPIMEAVKSKWSATFT